MRTHKIDFESLRTKSQIFVATSGGMDSMVLCHLLIQNGILFSIAHCNFTLRGKESDEDENFVKKFAKDHQIAFYTEKYNTAALAKENKTSIEEEARNLRYDFFRRLTMEYQIEAFLTAHHQDDQVETVLMRMISGTGFQGLQGIPEFRAPNFYRPLLQISQNEIKTYAIEHDISYREDSSNNEMIYKRNYIRHEILPKIETLNPNYREAFTHLAQLSSEFNELLIDVFCDLKLDFRSNSIVDLKHCMNKNYLTTILHFILSDYNPNRVEIQQLAAKLHTSELKRFQCGNVWLEVRKGIVSISKNSENKILKKR